MEDRASRVQLYPNPRMEDRASRVQLYPDLRVEDRASRVQLYPDPRVEGRASRVQLYPDLQRLYGEGVVETGSSMDLPIHRTRAVTPTAPPPDPAPALQDDLHLDLDVPEEPELDYTLEIEPDYDMEDGDFNPAASLNNLNLSAREKKILHDKNIEVPQQPRDARDFRAWMKWRMQANKLLAALILIRQGRHVCLRQSEVRRPPLSQESVHSIVQAAKGDQWRPPTDQAERTSLPGCPYIMYGIPRVRLATTAAKR